MTKLMSCGNVKKGIYESFFWLYSVFWLFELTFFFVVYGLPALAFLLLVFMVFRYGSRLGKISLVAFICLVAVVLYRVFSN